jgi:hypothetical protein
MGRTDIKKQNSWSRRALLLRLSDRKFRVASETALYKCAEPVRENRTHDFEAQCLIWEVVHGLVSLSGWIDPQGRWQCCHRWFGVLSERMTQSTLSLLENVTGAVVSIVGRQHRHSRSACAPGCTR